MRILLVLLFAVSISLTSFSQEVQKPELKNQAQIYYYAYITVEGKGFTKKLKVEADFGDTPEQIQTGEEYSEVLTNKKSYAAILNYMSENHFELVESRDTNFSWQGTGGTVGIIFIMRKKMPSTARE